MSDDQHRVSDEHRPSLGPDLVEVHFRALRHALRAKRVSNLSDLSLLLASDGVAVADAVVLLDKAASGDRRAVELAQLHVGAIAAHAPRSHAPAGAALLLLAVERLTASN
ncbi:MAG TPA: hypothetical protein VF954_02040 [Acidimicrobiales bacterium]